MKRARPAEAKEEVCEELQRCIDRWGLSPPYSSPLDGELWKGYYLERFALEFRDKYFWTAGGEELSAKPKCYSFEKCGKEKTEGPEEQCVKCKKPRTEVAIIPPDVHEAWVKEAPDGVEMPVMCPHCVESYASECHKSGTTHGHYTDLLTTIRGRVQATLASCPALKEVKGTEAGVYVLQYWINYEECTPDASIRTVELECRIYSPCGTGASVDTRFKFHYRLRFFCAHESYAVLEVLPRDLEDATPETPTKTGMSHLSYFRGRKSRDGAVCLAALDYDERKGNRKKFVTMKQLTVLRDLLFGDVAKRMSPRKMFAFLARGAGVCASGERAGWMYSGMRKKYKLATGEDSDGGEDGSEEGPCMLSFL